MKYFFDNCISHRFAKMLMALDIDVIALRDAFPQDIGDVELISKLKESHRVFVSCDRKQRTREREAFAIRESGLTSLWFAPFWSKYDFWEQAKWLVNRWELIDGYVHGVAPGTCAEVQQNGRSKPFQLR